MTITTIASLFVALTVVAPSVARTEFNRLLNGTAWCLSTEGIVARGVERSQRLTRANSGAGCTWRIRITRASADFSVFCGEISA